MLYLLQLIIGVALIAVGVTQEMWEFGTAAVAIGMACLVPLSWWGRQRNS